MCLCIAISLSVTLSVTLRMRALVLGVGRVVVSSDMKGSWQSCPVYYEGLGPGDSGLDGRASARVRWVSDGRQMGADGCQMGVRSGLELGPALGCQGFCGNV